MARPLRAKYANVAVTFAQSNVNTTTDVINFGSHTFVNNALVVYTSSSAVGGLTTNTNYYVVNTTPTTIQLATTSGGSPVNFTSTGVATDTLTATIIAGMQEMSDADLQDWVVPLIVNQWLDFPSTSPNTLVFNNPLSTNTSRGSATDTVRVFANNTTASLGDHQVVANVIATHTLYQTGAGTPESLATQVRPLFYNESGDFEVKAMTESEMVSHFWPAFFSAADFDAGGKGSWLLSSSAPSATGTWTERSSITDTYVTSGAPVTTTYKLYQRTDKYTENTSITHIRPLCYNPDTGRVIEMTDVQIKSIWGTYYKFIVDTGIGQYAFQPTTPTPGTWVSLGSYVNKLNDSSAQPYTGYFASSFTGTFSGTYTGAFTGQFGNQFTGAFTGPYVGAFTGLFSGAYSKLFTGAFSGNYAGSYVNGFTSTFSGAFAGTYQQAFTSTFAGNFTRAFSGIYTRAFTGLYSGSYQQTFTGLYNQAFSGIFVGRYASQAYAGTYTGAYVLYYSGTPSYFTGGYGSYFVSTQGSGTESFQNSGSPYQGAYTTITAYWSGTPATATYLGYYAGVAYTGLGLPRSYINTFTGAYGGKIVYYGGSAQSPNPGYFYFTGGYTGLFIANAKGYGTEVYAGAPYGAQFTGTVYYGGTPAQVNFAGMYQASWTGVKPDGRLFGAYATFASNFTGAYTSTYSGGYVGTFTGAYSGSYSGSFTGAYNLAYVGVFTGAYTGAFSGSYTGAFAQSFSRFFSGAYTGAYSQAFSGAFTGGYASSFSSFFTGVYSQAFTQGFTGAYSRTFTGLYNQAFTGAFSGAYTGLTVINTTTDTTTTLWIRSA